MRDDLASRVPPGSAVLLHACAHNPTGIDPTSDQWEELAQIFATNGHLALFDSAYQGYASGDLDADAARQIASMDPAWDEAAASVQGACASATARPPGGRKGWSPQR